MSEIIQKTESFVIDLLTNDLDSNYLYHNLAHTRRVVKSSKEIINSHSLNAQDSEALILAAWLHDTGYTEGSEGHEEKSCSIAKKFLEKQGYSAEGIKEVLDIIMATKRYYEPKTDKEQIIRDADASHFGQKSYMETCELLRSELSLLGIANYSSKEWLQANLQMLRKEHKYY
ncbi:MAG: HD domain-containing protein, partial [Maribacter sp.]|nr:HD domain-containing protein [Maribacter sp.]